MLKEISREEIDGIHEELASLRRLLDGVKDAVTLLSTFVKRPADGPPAIADTFWSIICEKIDHAQQPPATATGSPVVIVATESAGPSIARILARTNGVDATDANTSVGIDPAASAAATTNERATERREAQQMECDGCRSRVNLATYALTRDGGSFGNYRYCPSCADVDRRKGYSLELVPDGSQTELERVRKIMS
jgi:hypothetical protein